jgi:hypothetical protein
VLVLLLLGCGVILLLAFLGATSEPQHQVKSRLYKRNDTIVGMKKLVFLVLG